MSSVAFHFRKHLHNQKEISNKQLERTAQIAVQQKSFVQEEPFKNLLEKELKKIMKESNYSDVSMIYAKFYSQRENPEKILQLFEVKKLIEF